LSATRLYDAGYTALVPVIPPGVRMSPRSKVHPDNRGKIPGLRRSDGWVGMHDWQKYEATPKDPARWDRWGANVGMIADAYPGVDIDVDDEQLARVCTKFALEHLGPAPCRLSRGSRRLLVYRTDAPFPKTVLEIEYRGETHKVEVLGRGCQFLVHGTHPLGERYRWARSELWDVEPNNLALVGAADVQRYFSALSSALSGKGIQCRVRGTHDHERGPVPAQEDLRAPDLEALEDVVSRIPNTSAGYPTREDYVAFGHAVKAAGGDDALYIFQDWAGRWDEGVNDPEIVAADWDRMRPPFRIGWEWLRQRAGDDAQDEFEVDPTAVAPLPPAVYLTEEDFVERVLPEVRDQLRYVPEERRPWRVWNGHRWVEDKLLAAQRVIRDPLRLLSRQLDKRSKSPDIEKEAKTAYRAAAKKVQSDTGIRAVTSLLRVHLTCTPDQFDADRWVLNTPGKLIDLRTGRAVSRGPDDLLSKSTLVTPAGRYDPARAPRWSAFMEHISDGDPELAGFLQRYAGYCTTGDVGEKVFVFAWGPSGSGKSTFVNALSTILGDYAGHVAMETLLGAGRGRVLDDVAQLVGKRLVTAAEPQAGASWNDELVKAITGRDVLTVRKLYESNFQLRPQFKLLIGGNHEPKVGRLDDAMKRRLLIAPLTNVVPEAEEIGEYDALLVEEEGPQILAWMLEGCAAWQRDGLNPPAAVTSVTERYWASEDNVGQWIEDACELGPENEASRSELYESWCQWCGARGLKPGTSADLKQAMDGRGLDLQDGRVGSREGRVRGYRGIRVLLDLEGI
jgi:P4 family phage/plasmid primase-like protien